MVRLRIVAGPAAALECTILCDCLRHKTPLLILSMWHVCQLFFVRVKFVNSARLPCAARCTLGLLGG